MTEAQLKQIEQDAKETLDGINLDKLTKDSFILTGASLAILDHAEQHSISQGGIEKPEVEIKTATENESMVSILFEYIKDEISDAEKYYKLWMSTRKPKFLEISKQELSHFEFLVKMAREHGIGESKIDDFIARHNILMAKY